MTDEHALRAAAIEAFGRFCMMHGLDRRDPIERTSIDGCVKTVLFTGTAPDGRDFGVGYEMAISDIAA